MGASRARFAVSLGVLLSAAAPTAVWPADAPESGRETAREAESGDPQRETQPESDSANLWTRSTLTVGCFAIAE